MKVESPTGEARKPDRASATVCRPAGAPAGETGDAAREARGTAPEFSPFMLSLFLRARISDAVFRAGGPEPSGGVRYDATRKAKAAIRKAAGVTNFEFDFAWAGRLAKAETRLRLWGALGHVPADHGVTLTDDGGQLLASRAEGAPAGPRKGSDARSGLRPSGVGAPSTAEADSERTRT